VKKIALSAGHAAPIYAAVGGSIYVNDGSLYLDPEDRCHQWLPGQGLEAHAVRTLVVDPDDPYSAYAGVILLGEWSVFVTKDGGRTWRRTTPPPIEPVVPDTLALALGKGPDGKTVVYAGTVGCGVFRSEDAGATWDTLGRSRCEQDTDSGMPSDVAYLAVDALHPDSIYAATGQEVYHSDDGGFSWRQSAPEIASPIAGLVADTFEPDTVYLITASDGFWHSEDGAETWKRQDHRGFEGAEFTAVTTVPDEPGHLIVGASNGEVWETSDGGASWRSIRQDLAISSITSIATSRALDGKILVGSSHDGMALFEPGRLLRDVDGSKE
jgi:photosystem II stability/assembly factor-like uncharacterized protein